jgi:spermidine synthase
VGAEINSDDNLRLQYLAGFALNDTQADEIYGHMLMYRHYPDNLFAVSDQRKAAMMTAFEARGR